VVKDRPIILCAEYRLSRLANTLQRGLSAIAELLVNICVKVGDLTMSSSVWSMSHPPSRHLHCWTTPCVVSTTVQSQMELQSPCGVPQNTCITNHTCVVLLTCGVPLACRRTDTSSCSSRSQRLQTSANWRFTFAVSCFMANNWTDFAMQENLSSYN